MPTTIGVALWVIALLVPGPGYDTKKLAIYKFDTKTACETAIPYIKRYYRLYGDRWNGKCQQMQKTVLAPTTPAKRNLFDLTEKHAYVPAGQFSRKMVDSEVKPAKRNLFDLTEKYNYTSRR